MAHFKSWARILFDSCDEYLAVALFAPKTEYGADRRHNYNYDSTSHDNNIPRGFIHVWYEAFVIISFAFGFATFHRRRHRRCQRGG